MMWAASFARAVHALTEEQRLRLEDILLICSVITTTIGVAAIVGRVLWRRFALPEIRTVVHEVVVEETKELRVDGGASIKDAIGQLLAGQRDMTERMRGIEARIDNLEDR